MEEQQHQRKLIEQQKKLEIYENERIKAETEERTKLNREYAMSQPRHSAFEIQENGVLLRFKEGVTFSLPYSDPLFQKTLANKIEIYDTI